MLQVNKHSHTWTLQTWNDQARTHDDIEGLSYDACMELVRAHTALGYTVRLPQPSLHQSVALRSGHTPRERLAGEYDRGSVCSQNPLPARPPVRRSEHAPLSWHAVLSCVWREGEAMSDDYEAWIFHEEGVCGGCEAFGDLDEDGLCTTCAKALREEDDEEDTLEL